MDVMIYLPDDSGWQLHVQDGKAATCQSFFDAMVDFLNLPSDIAQKCFALWLESPLLDIQLKPHHIPFRMVKRWGLLLDRFSKSDDIKIIKDEPALVFKRSAFLTKEEEIKIIHPGALDILMMEAKSKIRRGAYPCESEFVEKLAIILCMIDKQQIADRDSRKRHDFMHTIRGFVPTHMTRQRRSILRRQKSVEERVYRGYQDVASNEKIENPRLEFMKMCWQLPYYGSVIFPGEVDNGNNRSFASWFRQNPVVEVHVAINTKGIWIIDVEKKCVLLGLSYGQFNWEVAINEADEADDPTPSLFIEFEEKKATKLLRVISKQASMMKAMIETCNSMVRRNCSLDIASNIMTDSPDEAASSSKQMKLPPDRQNSATFGKPGKLYFTTVSSQGKHDSPLRPVDEQERVLHADPKDFSCKSGFCYEEECRELL